MSKKLNDQEIVEVLNAMSDSAKRILKNIKKKPKYSKPTP